MGKNVFSVPIFFIVFRETLEAAIIVSVLLGLVEQIAYEDRSATTTLITSVDPERPNNPGDNKGEKEKERNEPGTPPTPSSELAQQPDLALEPPPIDTKRFIRRMRWQIFLGSALGLLIALAIGAAFIAVWFTKASDLWAKSEDLWEGAPPAQRVAGRAS